MLGKFKLLRDKTFISEKEWSAAKKPQMLLKALITRGEENVPIDMIIDDLWPDSSLDNGKRNFKVVLHRLRKILGHPASSLSHYVLFEMNVVSLNRKVVRLDIEEFRALCQSAKEAEQSGDIKSAIDFGKSAIELYKGDYLEDELYTRGPCRKERKPVPFISMFYSVQLRFTNVRAVRGNPSNCIKCC